MRVLVTGAAGQVGSEVVTRIGAVHEVVGLDHRACDLSDRDAVEGAVAMALPDAVVNCAAWTDVDGCESEPERAMAANALGPRHLAVACARIGAHLVHISTDYVFAGDKEGAYDEWDAPAPRSVYGRSKLGGEVEVARHASSFAIVRTSWVFGRGRNFVDTILGLAAKGQPLRVVADQRGCPTSAADLAGALARIAVERRAGVFHVTNAGACSWFELACAALEEGGFDPATVTPTSATAFPRPAPRPANSVLANVALAASGVPPLRPWREALVAHIRTGAAASEGVLR